MSKDHLVIAVPVTTMASSVDPWSTYVDHRRFPCGECACDPPQPLIIIMCTLSYPRPAPPPWAAAAAAPPADNAFFLKQTKCARKPLPPLCSRACAG